MAQYTLKDISSATGYSLPTVSRVLSGSDYPVKDEVRKVIEDYAKEVGYVPNLLARGLKTCFFPEVAVVIPSLSNPFYTDVLAGIDEELKDTGFSMVVYMFGRNGKSANTLINSLCSKKLAGVIIAADILATKEGKELAELKNKGMPVIVFDEVPDSNSEFNGVFFDYHKGGWLAAEHLYNMGHRKVAFISRVLDRPTRNELAEGIREFFRSKAGENVTLDIYQSDESESFAAGLNLAADVLTSSTPYTAIIANSDAVATGAMSALMQQNIKIPEQMSIIGLDDSIFARITTPLLSTVKVPAQHMGSNAARMILERVRANAEIKNVYLQPQLISRDTVRRLTTADSDIKKAEE